MTLERMKTYSLWSNLLKVGGKFFLVPSTSAGDSAVRTSCLRQMELYFSTEAIRLSRIEFKMDLSTLFFLQYIERKQNFPPQIMTLGILAILSWLLLRSKTLRKNRWPSLLLPNRIQIEDLLQEGSYQLSS